MHRLSSAFILGYHGCDRAVGEKLLSGASFTKSNNDYDWLGPGVYFWEANPFRAFQFAQEASKRKGSRIKHPFVVGGVIDLGLCFDATTQSAIGMLSTAYESLAKASEADGSFKLPQNGKDLLRRWLDCAVLRRVHTILEESNSDPIDTVKGVFTEGNEIYPGAGFLEKTHVQIAVCNLASIKAVFRVHPREYQA